MNKVLIKCPSCSKSGRIEISSKIIKSSSRGLIAVNIAKDIICDHNFIAYIDNNSNVRDYFISDFVLELPEITQQEKDKIGKIPSNDLLNLDLIKLNIPATLLTYILKSIFLKQKIVLILDQDFLYQHVKNFFDYITQNAFDVDIVIISKEQYKSNKKDYKDSMVFESINIIRNINNLINLKKLSVEKQIVSRFISEGDLGYSYIVLRNEIQRAYDYAKTIVDFINDFKERNETVNILKISTNLEEKNKIKINRIYLNFLIEIVINYFGVPVPSFWDSFMSSL